MHSPYEDVICKLIYIAPKIKMKNFKISYRYSYFTFKLIKENAPFG